MGVKGGGLYGLHFGKWPLTEVVGRPFRFSHIIVCYLSLEFLVTIQTNIWKIENATKQLLTKASP